MLVFDETTNTGEMIDNHPEYHDSEHAQDVSKCPSAFYAAGPEYCISVYV